MGVAITSAIIAASAVAASSAVAAKSQSSAAKNAADTQAKSAADSAKLQTNSANYAADIQAQSAREALDYSRGQSQLSLDQYNQQQTRLQPYRNLGNFAMGLPNEAAPSPLRLPGSQSGQAPPQQGSAAPTVNAGSGDIASQVAAYFKARGVTPNPTSVDYWAQKWNEFGAKDPAYFNQRLAIADEFGSSTGAAPTIAPRAPIQVAQSAPMTQTGVRAPLTAPLQTPQLRYRPLGSIGEY